jgi:hypothetical protein
MTTIATTTTLSRPAPAARAQVEAPRAPIPAGLKITIATIVFFFLNAAVSFWLAAQLP